MKVIDSRSVKELYSQAFKEPDDIFLNCHISCHIFIGPLSKEQPGSHEVEPQVTIAPAG
jgi:hypothetical protein